MKHAVFALLLTSFAFSAIVGQNQQPSSTSRPQDQKPPSPPQSDDTDVVKITTNLVQVDAVVTKDGKLVTDLKPEDFEIFEDGRRQTITSFAFISNSSQSPKPLATSKKEMREMPGGFIRPHDTRRTIALVVDDLGLSAESIGTVRKQLRKFVEEQVEPNDLVAVIRTGGTIGALQQFTNDRRLVDRAIRQVKWNPCSRVGVSVIPRAGTADHPEPCARSSMPNTMKALRFITEAMGELPGRKSMIVLSDSMPREDQEIAYGREGEGEISPLPFMRNYSFMLNRIAEMAVRSSVVIYAVDTQGLQYTGLTAADQINGTRTQITTQINTLMRSRSRLIQSRREGADLIARQTGGFLVRNSNDFQLKRILEDQSGYYLLGYRPSEETFNKTFHKIKAKVKRSGMTLRTRYGFFGVTSEEAAKVKERPTAEKTNIALMSPFGSQDINIELLTLFANDKTTGSILRSFLYIDAQDLSFKTDAEGAKVATIDLNGILFGDNGEIADRHSQTVSIRLRGEPYEMALRNGIVLKFDMPVKKPGAYQFRVAARDADSSRIGAAGEFVSIPNLNNKQLALSGILLRVAVPSEAGLASPNQETNTPSTLRSFAAGSRIEFACVIYNAISDPGSKRAQLEIEARVFHDDKVVFVAPPAVLEVGNQPDLTRLFARGEIPLDMSLQPGTYYLQIRVTDLLSKEKRDPIGQWVSFEIVK